MEPPRVLSQLQRLSRLELRAERVPGGFALFAAALPGGWVEVDFALGAPARLRVEGDGGATLVPLPPPSAGRIRALVRLPGRVQALVLEVDEATAPGPLRLRKVTPVEAAARLLAPLVRRKLREPGDLKATAQKLLETFRRGGAGAVVNRLVQKAQVQAPQLRYADWHARFSALTDADRAAIRARSAGLSTRFSIVMPVFDTPEEWLLRAIASVRAQLYPRWELCIADDASRAPHVRRVLEQAAAQDPRIRVVFREQNGHISAASNSALALATAEFVVLLDHDDELAEHALFVLATAAPDADLLYSDEDKLDAQGRLFEPHFKPDWNEDLFLSQNYLGHVCALRTSLVREVGGFRPGFEGSQDYDLCLRVAARTRRIRHLPFALYHWRAIAGSTALSPAAKAYPEAAARAALQEHVGAAAVVEPGPLPTTYRLRWAIPSPPPLVSLIIPTRDGRALLETCVESLLAVTAWRSFELLIVDNQSREPAALDYLQALERRGVARVLRFDHPFNFSALNNFAAAQARGTLLGLLNNDLEIIEPGWLDELVAQALRPGVGAVGARLLYPDRTLQHAGVILGIGGVAGHGQKHLARDDAGYFCRAQLVQNLSAVTAACLLVKADAYRAAGGLDERFAVAFNDVDFCLRLQQAGLRNLWTPFATLVHHESKSRGLDDTPAKRERMRGELALMRSRWGDALLHDPAYNPNLTLDAENFSLAWPPRVLPPWRAARPRPGGP